MIQYLNPTGDDTVSVRIESVDDIAELLQIIHLQICDNMPGDDNRQNVLRVIETAALALVEDCGAEEPDTFWG